MDLSQIRGALAPQLGQLQGNQGLAQGPPLGADSTGAQAKSGASNPFAPEKPLSELKPEELSKLGGGTALETLARTQSGLTIGEATPLLRNKPALESIASLMEQRSDVKVSDFVSKDAKGKTVIDPSHKDPEAMEFLKDRKDVQPSELSAMRSNFTKKFKNPAMGKEASQKGLELMKKRPDMKPDDVGKLMDTMGQAAGMDDKGGKGQSNEGASQATLDMFDSASKVLQKRPDMDAGRVGELANSVGKLGSPEDKQSPGKIAEGFDSATKTLEKNPLKSPEDMSRLASTVGDNFQGGDEKTGGARLDAFKTSSKMVGENTNMDHNTINNFLQQAKEKNPKMGADGGPQGAQKLAGALGDMASGVSSGTVSPNNVNSYFKTPQAELKGFKPAPKANEQQAGREEQKTGKDAQKPGAANGQNGAQAATGAAANSSEKATAASTAGTEASATPKAAAEAPAAAAPVAPIAAKPKG